MPYAADSPPLPLTRDAADDREQALQGVAERCARRGFSIAHRLLGDRAEAEDAVQEALARACEGWERLRDPAALDGWFFRVLTNLCMRALRRRRLLGWWRRSGESEAEPVPVIAVQPEAAIGCDAGVLLAAVDRLPAMQKAVVVLRYGEEMAIADIAAALDIGGETVKTHLARALARLRERIGGTP